MVCWRHNNRFFLGELDIVEGFLDVGIFDAKRELSHDEYIDAGDVDAAEDTQGLQRSWKVFLHAVWRDAELRGRGSTHNVVVVKLVHFRRGEIGE